MYLWLSCITNITTINLRQHNICLVLLHFALDVEERNNNIEATHMVLGSCLKQPSFCVLSVLKTHLR